MISFDSEKAFEDMFQQNEDFTFEHFGGDTLLRQVNIGHYGICDLIALSISEDEDPDGDIYKSLDVNIIELKNTPIKLDHFVQCAKYKTFFDNVDSEEFQAIDICVHLVGMKTFPSGSCVELLAQSIDWLHVYETEINPTEGIDFKLCSGWNMSDCDHAGILKAIISTATGLEDDS